MSMVQYLAFLICVMMNHHVNLDQLLSLGVEPYSSMYERDRNDEYTIRCDYWHFMKSRYPIGWICVKRVADHYETVTADDSDAVGGNAKQEMLRQWAHDHE